MRVLHIVPYFPPAWAYGGTPKAAYGLCRALASRGHEITVYTTDALNEGSRYRGGRETLLSGIRVIYFENLSNVLAWRQKLFSPIGMIPRLMADIGKFDVVHLHEFRTLQNAWAYIALRLNGRRVPLVIQAHGSSARVGRLTGAKALFDRALGRRMICGADGFIAVSRDELRHYLMLGADREKVLLIPPGIELEGISALPPKGKFRRRLRVGGRKICLYLGRIHRDKGIDHLIRAFARAKEDAVLVVAGPDDGYLDEARSLVSDLGLGGDVVFTGPLYGEEKYRALVDADLFVYPSRYEIFGLAPLEALACGTPLIISDRCGCRELVGHLGMCSVVPYGDEGKLADAIEDVLSGGGKLTGGPPLGGLPDGVDWGWRRAAELVEGLYLKVIGKKGKGSPSWDGQRR